MVQSDLKTNITDLLIDRVKKDPKLPLMAKQTEPNVWTNVSAADYLEEVKSLAKGFIAAGIEPGQRVGLMSKTRYDGLFVISPYGLPELFRCQFMKAQHRAKSNGFLATPAL